MLAVIEGTNYKVAKISQFITFFFTVAALLAIRNIML